MTAADQKNFLFKDILGSIALLAPWLMLLYQLSINWSTSEQYSHGYLVPFLSIYLFLKQNLLTTMQSIMVNYLFFLAYLLFYSFSLYGLSEEPIQIGDWSISHCI